MCGLTPSCPQSEDVAGGRLTSKGHTAWEGAGGPALPWALGGSGCLHSLIQRHWAQVWE